MTYMCDERTIGGGDEGLIKRNFMDRIIHSVSWGTNVETGYSNWLLIHHHGTTITYFVDYVWLGTYIIVHGTIIVPENN